MKRKSTSQSAFFNLRIVLAALFCLVAIAMALFAIGAFSSAFGQGKGGKNNSTTNQASPSSQTPDVVQMVGPVGQDTRLRDLPYVPPKAEFEERRLTRYPHLGEDQTNAPSGYGISGLAYVQALLKNIWRPTPTIPAPLLTFEGLNNTCSCAPPDPNGDVGPNHYVEAVNVSSRFSTKTATRSRAPLHSIRSLPP